MTTMGVASPTAIDPVASGLRDLSADLDELLFIARSASVKLGRLVGALEAARPELQPATHAELRAQLRSLGSRYGATATRLLGLAREAVDASSEVEVYRIAAERDGHADLLRTLQALLAAVATAADWQSPSILRSIRASAGLQAGAIVAHVNDYKRDRHLDAESYERAYVAAPAAILKECGRSSSRAC